MTRLNLLLALVTPLALAAACDLDDKSIGDSGSANDDGGSDGSAGDDNGDDNGDGGDDGPLACTEIGCDDQLAIDIEHGDLTDGEWEVVIAEQNGPGGETCAFSVAGGAVTATDCNASPLPGTLTVFASQLYAAVDVQVRFGGVVRGSASGEITYQQVQPNGPGCEPICTQGGLTVVVGDLVAPACDTLDADFSSGLDAAKTCADVTECGQTGGWGTCGCTRQHVLRLDADAAALDAIWNAGIDGECEFTQVGGTCDCPEADGFACIDNRCTWNYL